LEVGARQEGQRWTILALHGDADGVAPEVLHGLQLRVGRGQAGRVAKRKRLDTRGCLGADRRSDKERRGGKRRGHARALPKAELRHRSESWMRASARECPGAESIPPLRRWGQGDPADRQAALIRVQTRLQSPARKVSRTSRMSKPACSSI